MTNPTQIGQEEVRIGGLQAPSLGLAPYTDRVRFRLAMGLVVAVASVTLLLIVLVAGGHVTVADAKELALTAVALFGIVSPVIGFYFATVRGS